MTFIKRKNLLNFFFIAYIFGGFLAVLFSLKYGFNKESVGVAILFGSILAFFERFDSKLLFKPKTLNIINLNKQSSISFKLSFIFWALSLTVSSLFLLDSLPKYSLSFEYFLFLSLAFSFIVAQIFLGQVSNFNCYIILTEIFTLSTFLSSSFLFLFTGPYGNDASYHVEYITSILNSGSVNVYIGQYIGYPFYHLLFVFSVILSGITNLKIIQFLLIILQNVFVLLMYLTSRKLFNQKIALITALIISVTTYLLVPKYMYSPGSFSVIIFMLILYLFFNKTKTNFFPMTFLLVLTFISLIFYHPLTSVFILFSFISFFLILNLLSFSSTTTKVSFSFLSLALVLILSKWMSVLNDGTNLFFILIKSIEKALNVDNSLADSVSQTTLSPDLSFKSALLYDFGFVLLLLLGIFGAFSIFKTCIDQKNDDLNEKRILFSTVLLIFIPIPYILAFIYPQSLPSRWFPFIEVLSASFAGLSIFSIYYSFYNSKLRYLSYILIFTLIFFSISSPIVNPNSSLYGEDLANRAGMIQSEVKAVSFINEFVNISEVHANSKYLHFINRDIFNYDHFIDPSDPQSYVMGVFVIREEDLTKGFTIPLYGANNKFLEISLPSNEFYNSIYKCNKIYTSNKIAIYDQHEK